MEIQTGLRESSGKLRTSIVTQKVRGACIRWTLLAFGILITLGTSPTSLPQTNTPSEYQLKAAFLFNFAKFVDWPPGAFSNDEASINVCILGEDPFGSAFDELIRGKKINSRGIAIRRTQKIEDLKICHVIFISVSEDGRLPEILGDLKDSSALIVGESSAFAARGGGIQFYMDDGKVRFSVNVDAIQRSRLTVSAKLLSLARIVHDNRATGG